MTTRAITPSNRYVAIEVSSRSNRPRLPLEATYSIAETCLAATRPDGWTSGDHVCR